MVSNRTVTTVCRNLPMPIHTHSVRFACLIVAMGLAIAAISSPALANQYAFYDVSAAELRGHPGTIIRAEPFPGAPGGASAYRVL